jgi:hypothetical protein
MKSHTPNRQKPPARSIKGQRVLQLSPVDLEIIFTTTPCLDLAAGSPNNLLVISIKNEKMLVKKQSRNLPGKVLDASFHKLSL